MQNKYILHSTENCSNCKHRIKQVDFPYFCSLKKEYTGELIKCKEWESD